MKYLLAALLLSASPAIMADLLYMDQQMIEMHNRHQQQMLERQQRQEQETRSYLQQQQEREERRLNQLNIGRHSERQARPEGFDGQSEWSIPRNGLNRSERSTSRRNSNRSEWSAPGSGLNR
jgi:hypothetical protein